MNRLRVKPDSGLNLRCKPNGEVRGVLAHNEELELLDEVTFYRVKDRQGNTGYVHGDYVERLVSGLELAPMEVAGGWSPEFELVTYTHERFVGEKVRVDRDFIAELDKLAGFAEQCDVKIWVTSSIRQLDNQIKGVIVKPAAKSCHHIGHAIDMNVIHDGALYNSKKLKVENHSNLPDAVCRFLQLVRDDEVLRWGGDFSAQDPVHIDDNLYHRDKLLYAAKLDRRVDTLNA